MRILILTVVLGLGCFTGSMVYTYFAPTSAKSVPAGTKFTGTITAHNPVERTLTVNLDPITPVIPLDAEVTLSYNEDTRFYTLAHPRNSEGSIQRQSLTSQKTFRVGERFITYIEDDAAEKPLIAYGIILSL